VGRQRAHLSGCIVGNITSNYSADVARLLSFGVRFQQIDFRERFADDLRDLLVQLVVAGVNEPIRRVSPISPLRRRRIPPTKDRLCCPTLNSPEASPSIESANAANCSTRSIAFVSESTRHRVEATVSKPTVSSPLALTGRQKDRFPQNSY
jgi:hypothetical protein